MAPATRAYQVVLRFLIPAFLAGVGTQPVRGTLIVAVPFKTGVVICGDRRVVDSEGAFTDDMQKVLPIGTRAAFSVNGRPIFVRSDNGQTSFDAFSETTAFFQGDRTRLREVDLTRFRAHLRTKFLIALEILRPEHRPAPTTVGKPLFTIAMFWIDDAGNRLMTRLDFIYDRVELANSVVTRADLVIDSPQLFGNTIGWEALIDRKDEAPPIVSTYLRATPPPSLVSQSTGRQFAEELIRFSSGAAAKWGPLGDISPTAICALVDRYAGFVLLK